MLIRGGVEFWTPNELCMLSPRILKTGEGFSGLQKGFLYGLLSMLLYSHFAAEALIYLLLCILPSAGFVFLVG